MPRDMNDNSTPEYARKIVDKVITSKSITPIGSKPKKELAEAAKSTLAQLNLIEKQTKSIKKNKVEQEKLNKELKLGTLEQEDYDKSLKKLIDSYKKLKEELKETKEEYSSQKTHLEELVEAEGINIKLLNNKNVILRTIGENFQKGADSVQEYTEAIEKSGSKMVVVGAAAYYMAGKIKELGEETLSTAESFARFDIHLSSVAGTTLIAPGGVKQLQELRTEMQLTTSDFMDFSNVATEGVNSGSLSIANLKEAMIKLNDTYGKPQTEKLQSFVDLIQSIPTLQTDLSITASFDDQAASWFALAKEGKVSQVLELQAAGLLGGGGEGLEGVENQKELLKGTYKVEKLTEDISKEVTSIVGHLGQVGPLLVGGIATLGTIGAGIAGVLQFTGGMRQILSKMFAQDSNLAQNLAVKRTQENKINTRYLSNRFAIETNKVVSAIRMNNAIGSRGGRTPIAGNLARKGTSGGVKGASTIGKAGKVGRAAKGVGGGFAGLAGGLALGYVSDKLMDSGHEKAGKVAQAGGIGLEVAGWAKMGATIGTFIAPGIGTAIGGAIGGAIGIASNWGEVTEIAATFMDKNNKSIQESTRLRMEESLIIKDMLQKQQNSALQMQMIIKSIDNAANTLKAELSNMKIETYTKDLEVLSEVGGSLLDFDSIVSQTSSSVKDKFSVMISGFEESRKTILKNNELNAKDRKSMLLYLHNKELEAIKEFTNGIMDLVGEFDKIPSVIANNLRTKISDIKLDFELDRTSSFEEFDKVIANQVSNLNDIFSRYGNDLKIVENYGKEIDLKNQESLNSIIEGIGEIEGKWRKELEDVFKFDEVSGKVDFDEKIVEELKKKTSGIMDVMFEEHDKLSKLPNLLKAYDKTFNDMDKYNEETKDGGTSEINPNKVEKERDSLMGEIRNHMINVAKHEKAILMLDKDILEAARERSIENLELVQMQDKELKGVEKANAILEKTNVIVNSNVAKQQMLTKTTEALFDNIKSFMDTIDRIADYVGKSFESQVAQSNVDLFEKQSELFVRSGSASKMGNEMLKSYTKNIQEQSNDLKESTKRIKELEEITKDQAKFVKSGRESFNKLKDEMKEDLDGGNMSIDSLKKNTTSEFAAKEINRLFDELIGTSNKINELSSELVDSNGLTGERKKQIEDEIKALEKQNKDRDNVLSKTIQGGVANKEIQDYLKSRQEVLKSESNLATSYKAITNKVVLGKQKLKNANAEIINTMMNMIDQIADLPSKIDDSFNIKTFNATREAAVAFADLAAEAWNFTEVAKQNEIAYQSSIKEFKEAQKQLKEMEGDVEGNFQKMLDNMKQMVEQADNPEDKATRQKAYDDFKAGGKELMLSNQKVKLAEKEAKMKEIVVQNAERARRTEEERLDMQIDLMSETISYMEEMGASVGDILEMRRQEISLVAQSIPIIEKQLDAFTRAYNDALMSGDVQQQELYRMNIEKTRTELTKKQMELQKKALGAQRDAYDKMLGLAFGEIRSARGARKGMMSDASVFGRGFVQQSGTDMIIAGSAGQAQTLDERSSQYMYDIGGGKSMQELKDQVGSITGSKFGTDGAKREELKPMNGSQGIPETNKSPIIDLPQGNKISGKLTDKVGSIEEKQLMVQEEIRDLLSGVNKPLVNQSLLSEDSNKRIIGLEGEGTNVAYTSVKGYEQFDRKPTILPQKELERGTSNNINTNVVVSGEVTVKFNTDLFATEVVNIVTKDSRVSNYLNQSFVRA